MIRDNTVLKLAIWLVEMALNGSVLIWLPHRGAKGFCRDCLRASDPPCQTLGP
jgi:hypothetical protein